MTAYASLAPLVCTLALALALAFRRHRAAQVLAVIALALMALPAEASLEQGQLAVRALAATTMFAPWLLLLAMAMPEPPLRSRRMLAFAGLLALIAWFVSAAPTHVWSGLENTLPLGLSAARPRHVALAIVVLAALVAAARGIYHKTSLDLALSASLVALACGWIELAGISLRLWFLVAAIIAAIGVIHSSWRLAFLDALTGLPNRRALDETLARLSGNYALAMVDVDHFKQFNDKHGHDAGDRVLREVARSLARTRGANAFRFGGEEFCLLFRRTDTATDACEDARAAIENLSVVLPHKPAAKASGGKSDKGKKKPVNVSVTASIGLAARGADRRSAAEVLKAADQCLYRAKGKGRNQVIAST